MSEAQVNSVQTQQAEKLITNRAIDWAADNLSDEAISAFDSVVDSGNPMAISIAFQGIQSEYNEANGYEGNCYKANLHLLQAMCLDHKPNLSQRWETHAMTPTQHIELTSWQNLTHRIFNSNENKRSRYAIR